MSEWQPIETAPRDKLIWTKIDDAGGERNVQKLVCSRHLWWLPDKKMYVYYTPTHWREAEPPK